MRMCEEALEDWTESGVTCKRDFDYYPDKPFYVDLSMRDVQTILYNIGVIVSKTKD